MNPIIEVCLYQSEFHKGITARFSRRGAVSPNFFNISWASAQRLSCVIFSDKRYAFRPFICGVGWTAMLVPDASS